MMDIITLSHNNDGKDFVIEGNHAKISQNKVAEITKVNQSTVSRWLCTNNLNTESNHDIAYLSGYALKEFVTYLALDAKRISTDKGKEFGKYLTSTGKSGDNTLYQQLFWFESILAEL